MKTMDKIRVHLNLELNTVYDYSRGGIHGTHVQHFGVLA